MNDFEGEPSELSRNEVIRKALDVPVPEHTGETEVVRTIYVEDLSGNLRQVDFIEEVPPTVLE